MIRITACLVLLPALALAAPAADEVNALSLLAGARQLMESGVPTNESTRLNDGTATKASQWEPEKRAPTLSIVLQLAEPFDLNRLEAVNSFSESDYPGISTKKLRLEQGPSRSGPWKPLAEVSLRKGTAPQSFAFPPAAGVRYVRVTLAENYGNAEWWSLAELAVYGRRSRPRAQVDFTGQWDTSYGPMRLVQKGDRITGCYGSNGANLVEGTREGPVFFGTYTEGENRGAMAFALTAERELSGVYGNDIAGSDRDTRWDGTPLEKLAMKCGAPPEDALENELKTSGRVVLRGILFDTGKDVIRGESIPVLTDLARAIRRGGGTYVIEGHTDDRGGAPANQVLSEKRAASVRKWLVENGVKEGVLTTVGYGQSRPAMPNDSEAGRAANRRVEVAAQGK